MIKGNNQAINSISLRHLGLMAFLILIIMEIDVKNVKIKIPWWEVLLILMILSIVLISIDIEKIAFLISLIE